MYFWSICLLTKNDNEYINEWLDWHLNKIKFEHVYMYDNESTIPIKESINQEYLKYITFIEMILNIKI